MSVGVFVSKPVPVPLDSALKLLLDVGEERGRVTVHHVSAIEALCMSDPDPSKCNAL